MHPRVLIVGTVPYNTRATSRAFDAYFHHWEKENLAQIFSDSRKPCKGHCGTLYQITDQRMARRWMNKRTETGAIYRDEELEAEWESAEPDITGRAGRAAYRIGRRHTPLTHLMRGLLWRRKYWCTEKLQQWMDAFRPECIFLAFSDDYFIPQIALYAAERYGAPIVSCIGDDYYFNSRKTANPLYYLYKTTYRRLIDRIFAWPGSAIYISDKIRDKYNEAFSLDGETVYLASTVERKPFRPANTQKLVITYFGNIRMGRNESLDEIGQALGQIDKEYKMEIYSNEENPKYYRRLEANPQIRYMGSVAYAKVRERMAESDMTVIVEGFREKDINLSRYSLSTKAADALASGACILAYGSGECGIIEYLRGTGAATVCTEKGELARSIRELLEDPERQKRYYDAAIAATKRNHNLEASCKTSEKVIREAIEKSRGQTPEWIKAKGKT